MIAHLRARRAVRQARRQYELTRLENLVEDNKRWLEFLQRSDSAKCKVCAAMDEKLAVRHHG